MDRPVRHGGTQERQVMFRQLDGHFLPIRDALPESQSY